MKIDEFLSKPRTLKEVAAFLNLSEKTVRRWLRIAEIVNEKRRNKNYFTIAELKSIINELG